MTRMTKTTFISCLTAGVIVLSLAGCGGADTEPKVAAADGTPAAPAEINGEEIYNRYCFSCHAAGIAGAPKHGDREAWQPRVAKGRDLLLQSTINGIAPGMPPRGACIGCSDEELDAAITYMLDALEDPS